MHASKYNWTFWIISNFPTYVKIISLSDTLALFSVF